MANDEAQVQTIIERWAQAVASGDRAAIIAHHAPDMLMFDFPDAKKGIEAYDEQWNYFYLDPKGSISFDVSDLEVTAGDDVAFATCNIHCDGTSAGALDLRVTTGLRKIDGEWTVIHEHHSVPTVEERFLGASAAGEAR